MHRNMSSQPSCRGQEFGVTYWLLFCEHACMHMCVLVPQTTEATREQQIPLELELQAFVYCPLWVLGTELWCSGRAESPLKHGVISQSPLGFFFFLIECVYVCRIFFSN